MRRVGKLIRQARKAQGISTEAVSCAVGRNRCFCNHLELGKSWTNAKTLFEIADFLKIDKDLIFVAYMADRNEEFNNSLKDYRGISEIEN